MKRKSLYALTGLVLLSMASCSDDYTDWANPQSSAQEPAITIPGFSSSYVGDASYVVDLSASESDSVKLFSLAVPALPEGYSVENVRAELLDGNQSKQVLNGDVNGRVATAELQDAVVTSYGKRPTARPFTVHIYANATKNGEAVFVDAGSFEAKVSPSAPYRIDDGYYFQYGDNNTAEFTHSSADVYDDPVFTVTVKTTEDNATWQIVSSAATNDEGLYFGPEKDGSTELSGKLVSENAGKGVLGKAGHYRITINMWERTYAIEALNFAPYIYAIGNNTSWSSTIPLAGVNYDGTYRGFAYLNGEFKFKPNPADNWTGDWEKASGDAYSGTLTENGSSNIDAPETGFYMMDVNIVSMTYNLTRINTIGLIGDATSGGWDTDTEMTYDVSEGCWTVTTSLVDGKFKFRANKGWDINWGGSTDNLTSGGSDISVSAGNYTIKLYLSCEGMNHCTMTKN